MTAKVKLSEIIDGLESSSYENEIYVNRSTGEVIHISNYYLRKAEDEELYEHMAEWERDLMKTAIDIIENESNYVPIYPFEVNEYEMMERFCNIIKNPIQEEKLLHSIRGKGAFRRFEDTIYQFGLQNEWYDYRDNVYKQLAKR